MVVEPGAILGQLVLQMPRGENWSRALHFAE
jgi:hypothetical protein